MSEPGGSYLAFREQLKRDTCKAFGVKPWQIGAAPVPWWVPYWRKVRFPLDWIRMHGRRATGVELHSVSAIVHHRDYEQNSGECSAAPPRQDQAARTTAGGHPATATGGSATRSHP